MQNRRAKNPMKMATKRTLMQTQRFTNAANASFNGCAYVVITLQAKEFMRGMKQTRDIKPGEMQDE